MTRDFYSYDGGARFTGDELMALIKTAHASGKVFVWNVTKPEVRMHGDVAWITYVNEGSVKDASGTRNVTWLESAFLGRKSKTGASNSFTVPACREGERTDQFTAANSCGCELRRCRDSQIRKDEFAAVN